MKRTTLLTSALLFLFVGNASAAPTWVQGNATGNSTGATFTSWTTPIGAVTGSPLHICGILTWGGTDATLLQSLTDDKGNTYTVLTPVVDTANQQVMAQFY